MELTDTDIQKMIRLRHSGLTWEEIARELGVRNAKALAWYGGAYLGIMNRERFEEAKQEMAKPGDPNKRPGLSDFLWARFSDNRGWGDYLDDEPRSSMVEHRVDVTEDVGSSPAGV